MAATALRNTDKAVSDTLLIMVILKGLPSNCCTTAAIVVQQDKKMTFTKFKVSLRSYVENERDRYGSQESGDNIIALNEGERFDSACFNCGKSGHKKSECWKERKMVQLLQKQDA